MDLLFDLATERDLQGSMRRMYDGCPVNSTEGRSVLHHALRFPPSHPFPSMPGVVPDVHAVLGRVSRFASAVRDGTHAGASGKALTNVVAIGIGGSQLGPEFVHEALRCDAAAGAAAEGRTLRFLANVDPVDVRRAFDGLDPERTLVVVVSKTFTTAETMLNARSARKWLLDGMGGRGVGDTAEVMRRQFVAVSSAVEKAKEFGIEEENVFGFWDWVGGR